MTELDNYLVEHYLDAAQLASAAGLAVEELDAMIGNRLVPAPSYSVAANGTVTSFVFGMMNAPGARPGRYFHPAQLTWISTARGHDTEAQMKAHFTANYAAALATLNDSTWHLADSFDKHGAPIDAGLHARLDTAWTYFLNGTFALCVANPVSAAHIAYKEVLQEKLMILSENGKKLTYAPDQFLAMQELIAAYAAAAMPFSPVEYALSSRKRLVEDLRANMRVTEAVS